MGFVYRLQKVLELREDQLESLKTEYQQALLRVAQAKQKVKDNEHEQYISKSELSSGNTGLPRQIYLNHIEGLKEIHIQLTNDVIEAEKTAAEVFTAMLESQKKTEGLRKHRVKALGEFNEEELKKEEKELNEIGLLLRRLRHEDEKRFTKSDE